MESGKGDLEMDKVHRLGLMEQSTQDHGNKESSMEKVLLFTLLERALSACGPMEEQMGSESIEMHLALSIQE
jgi:uncharacterized protein (DUF1786 family)